ncbi:hypothetical protein IEO21_11214 [Rhodonia placenta]|uniref:CCHC-type domain-containing protein n=1 Tax=Rhodonia placenta TaxID=104341 RepID=A0A8H7TUR6_9APHY|nr:hypothetical protein IEO21_11214 [Postia placenta]
MSPASSYEFQLNPNESTTSRILKLIEDGSNWILYKEQFRAAVYAKGLVRFLEGRDKAPVPTTAPGVDPDADEHYESANDVWVAKHQSIWTILFQTLPESLKLRIASLQKASEAWQVIVDEYDNQGEFVQVELLRQMHALRCAEDSDPRPTLNQLEKVRSEYATAGGQLSDTEYKAIILSCLPMSYRGVVRTIITSARISSLSELIRQINAIARDEFALNNSRSTSDAALIASNTAKCANCNKPGHSKPDCWSKGGGKEGQGPRSKARKAKAKVKGSGGETAKTASAQDGDAFAVTSWYGV